MKQRNRHSPKDIDAWMTCHDRTDHATWDLNYFRIDKLLLERFLSGKKKKKKKKKNTTSSKPQQVTLQGKFT
jgi:hypothetical protein